MHLYVVRHAAAFARDPERWPDDRDRPLTGRGVRHFRRLARLLRTLAPEVDLVLRSPLGRAWQPAQVLEGDAGWPGPEVCPELEPDTAPAVVVAALASHAETDAVALVGHEPDLHLLIGYLLAGGDSLDAIEMKKGAVACLKIDGPPGPATATLRWLITPGVARAARG